MENVLAVLIPIALLTGLSVLFAGVLAWANVRFKVEKDPKIDLVLAVLPGANCGACGYAGCAAFAEAVVSGEAPVNGCPVGRKKVADAVGEILGVPGE